MEAYFALAKVGAVIVPLNWRLVADELEIILKDSGTERLIFGDEFVETAVIGQQSAKWGESPLAIIVKNDDALTQAEVLNYCEGKLTRFKQPQAAVFVDEIPRNPSGKILKRLLREQFSDPAPI